MLESCRQAELLKQRRLGRRKQAVAMDIGPQQEEPFSQPSPLEPSVPGYQDFFPAVMLAER